MSKEEVAENTKISKGWEKPKGAGDKEKGRSARSVIRNPV